MRKNKSVIVTGFLWTGIQLSINQGFAFAIRIVLAKILFPEQFGLVGMATVFIGFIQIFNDIGFGAALVQRKTDRLRPEHFYTAFWTGATWSILLYLLISLIIGPLAADFYKQPVLLKLVPILSLGILSSPVNLVHKAQLTKGMNFKRIAFIDNVSNVIAGLLSLLLAYLGFGVWSLAFNSIASIVIAMPMYFNATKWIPKFKWEKEAFKDIFGFGVFTTGVNVLNYWMQNLDYLLIGKLMNSKTLGIYTLAFLLTDTFRMKLMAVINSVMFPVFSQKQDDIPKIITLYKKNIFYNCLISFPIMTFFVVCGRAFLESFFGDKWVSATVPLQILSVSVMFHMMTSGNNAVVRAMGKSKLEFKIQIIKAAIYIPMLVIGIKMHGIVGAAWVVLINKILAVFLAQNALNKTLNVNLNKDIKNEVLPLLAASTAAGLVAYCCNTLNAHYIISGISLLITYFFVIVVLRKDILTELRSVI